MKSCTFSLRSSSPLNEEARKAWLGTTTSNVSLSLWAGSAFLIALIKFLTLPRHHTLLPVVPPLVVGKGRHFSKFTELLTHNWEKIFRLLESTWFVRKIDYGEASAETVWWWRWRWAASRNWPRDKTTRSGCSGRHWNQPIHVHRSVRQPSTSMYTACSVHVC